MIWRWTGSSRLKARKTSANGEVWIGEDRCGVFGPFASRMGKMHGYRTPDARFSQIVTDRLAIVFEWDRRVSFVDIETGKSVLELPVPQFADSINARQLGAPRLCRAAVQGDTLFFLSKTRELSRPAWTGCCCPALAHPVDRKIDSMARSRRNHLYAGIVRNRRVARADSSRGTIASTLPMGLGWGVDYADQDIAVATDRTMLYRLDRSPERSAGSILQHFQKDAAVVKGIVTGQDIGNAGSRTRRRDRSRSCGSNSGASRRHFRDERIYLHS